MKYAPSVAKNATRADAALVPFTYTNLKAMNTKQDSRFFKMIYDVCIFPEELKLPKYKPFIMVAFSYGPADDVMNAILAICDEYRPGTLNINTTHFKYPLISKN